MKETYDYSLLQDKLNYLTDHTFSWQSFAESVIHWNYLANDLKHPHGDVERYENQLKLVREEFREALTEIEAGNTEKLKSELIDLVVVSSYGMYLLGHRDFDKIPVMYGKSLTSCASKIMDFGDPHEAFHWAAVTLELLGGFEEIADKVLQQNNNKIPLVRDFIQAATKHEQTPCTLEEAIRLQILKLEKMSEGRYKGFREKVIDFGGNQYIVFKDSNGKIMKPYTFYIP